MHLIGIAANRVLSWTNFMQPEANKKIVGDYLARSNAGDIAGCLALLAEDFELVCRALSPLAYRMNRAETERVMEGARGTMRGPLQFTIEQMTAEDDRVAVQASSRAELVNGGEYRNTYHFLFTLREAHIMRIDEYLCSFTMAKLLDSSIWDWKAQNKG